MFIRDSDSAQILFVAVMVDLVALLGVTLVPKIPTSYSRVYRWCESLQGCTRTPDIQPGAFMPLFTSFPSRKFDSRS